MSKNRLFENSSYCLGKDRETLAFMCVFQVTFLTARLKLPVKYEEKRFLLNNEQRLSFEQCFEKAIRWNKRTETNSLAIHLGGSYCKPRTTQGTNQISPFHFEPVCHKILAREQAIFFALRICFLFIKGRSKMIQTLKKCHPPTFYDWLA